MPAIRSDVAFNRVYRGNQSSIGTYFVTGKRGFRFEIGIGGHSSSDIILVSNGIRERETKESGATTSFSWTSNLLALSRQNRTILSSPHVSIPKARWKKFPRGNPINCASLTFCIIRAVDNLIKFRANERREPWHEINNSWLSSYYVPYLIPYLTRYDARWISGWFRRMI